MSLERGKNMPKMKEKKIKRKAVIIGINNYKDKKIKNLEGAVNDAKGMKKVLKEWGTFDIDDNHFLTDEDANCDAIRATIWDSFIDTNIYECVLFYFSGHGFMDGYGNGYIAPHDMIKKKPFVKGIDMGELRKIIFNSKHENVLMIFDCCYSGIAARGEKVKDPFKEFFEDIGKGKFILASCEENKKSEEKDKLKLEHEDKACAHGIYTFHLLEGLYGYGKADDTGKITLRSLAKHVKDKMKNTKQKSDLWYDYAGSLGDFVIGVVPEIRGEFIIKKLKKAKRNLKDDIVFLMAACAYIHEVLKISPKNSEAEKIRGDIINKLKDYRKKAKIWLMNNESEIKVEYQLEYLWKEIEYLWKYFDFYRIADIEEEKVLFTNLWKISTGVCDLPDFIEMSKDLVQPQQ